MRKRNTLKTDKKSGTETAIKKQKAIPKWFYLVLIFIPIMFLLSLEILLREFNYGLDYTEFVSISKYHPDKYYLNPKLPYKFFYNVKSAPTPLPDGFDIVKKENSFRVFVLGESSVEGWPYVPNASFPRQLKRKLELYFPKNTIEVINCGISAINSYTVRDLIPGILAQKPDLVIIYTGHNEYYGALGVASSVNLINSRYLVNTYLWLSDFKTVQLVQNFLRWINSLFSSIQPLNNLDKSNETLMSRMIGESLIDLDSDLFYDGINQFQGNMDDVLKILTAQNIPVILSTLTCNLKDQKPFISTKTKGFPSAELIYENAQESLRTGDFEKSKQLFLYAKELDALRFRAPQKINGVIRILSKKYNCQLVDIDSVFSATSPTKIAGNNLFVDHLHPNIEGYRVIANTIFDLMVKSNLHPRGEKKNLSDSEVNKILKENFPFTRLDSTIADLKIITLTGQYPFVPRGTSNTKLLEFKKNDIVDSIAVDVFNKKILWETAHVRLSDHYFENGDYYNCIREIETIIAERPYFDVPYKNIVIKLIKARKLDEAEKFLQKLHILKPSYFTYKWLGQLYLEQNRNKEALKYLIDAIKYNEADYQTYYNLAGAYYLVNDLSAAIRAIQESLRLNSKNKTAQNFYNQLISLKRGQNKKPQL